jgi:hypothetical protein
MAAKEYTTVDAGGREMRLSSPSKVYFPAHDDLRLDTVPARVAQLEPRRVQPSRAKQAS